MLQSLNGEPSTPVQPLWTIENCRQADANILGYRPSSPGKVYSVSSVVQLSSCIFISVSRKSFERMSHLLRNSGTLTVGNTRISVELLRGTRSLAALRKLRIMSIFFRKVSRLAISAVNECPLLSVDMLFVKLMLFIRCSSWSRIASVSFSRSAGFSTGAEPSCMVALLRSLIGICACRRCKSALIWSASASFMSVGVMLELLLLYLFVVLTFLNLYWF